MLEKVKILTVISFMYLYISYMSKIGQGIWEAKLKKFE